MNSWGCFDTIEEYSEGGGRKLITDRDQDDVSWATALHITIAASSRHGIGAVLGYPIGTPDATSDNILVGLGYRHRSGLEVAAGVHAFHATALRTAYRTPIDLTAPGNEALTVDAVTETELRAGAFILIGFAPDLLPILR